MSIFMRPPHSFEMYIWTRSHLSLNESLLMWSHAVISSIFYTSFSLFFFWVIVCGCGLCQEAVIIMKINFYTRKLKLFINA